LHERFAVSEQFEWDHEEETFLWVRPTLEDAKHMAKQGDLDLLRHMYPEIREHINERKRKRGERRRFSDDRRKRAKETIKFIRKLRFQTYGIERQRRDDGMPHPEDLAEEFHNVVLRSNKSRRAK
jgi:hypothetical protein